MSGRPDFEPITSSDDALRAEMAEPGVPRTPPASPTEPGHAAKSHGQSGTTAPTAGEAAVGSADSEGLQPQATFEATPEATETPTEAPARRKRPIVADDHVPTPRDKLLKVGVMLPPETWRALRQRGTDRRCSLNFLILQALKRDNLPVKTADLIDDGRRQNARSKRR